MKRTFSIFLSHLPSQVIMLTFAFNSVLFATWILQLPYMKQKLGIGEGLLGIALFFAALGAMLAMLTSGYIVHKMGEGKATFWSAVAYATSLLLPILANNLVTFSILLFLMGACTGLMDIAMNAAASRIEKVHRVKIMSACHGFFSMGGMIGAGMGSLLIGFGVSPIVHLYGGIALMVLLLLTHLKSYLLQLTPENEEQHQHLFVIPRGPMLGLAVIAFCILVGEGAVADWSTIYLEELLPQKSIATGFGFAGFSLSMTVGRLYGDNIIDHYGGGKIVALGSLIALIGIVLVVFATPPVIILGFTLVGLGYSCVVPVLFSSGANLEGVPSAYGIASVASAGYLGFLVGPVFIGLIAEEFGLSTGFGLLLLLTSVALLLGPRAIHRGDTQAVRKS